MDKLYLLLFYTLKIFVRFTPSFILKKLIYSLSWFLYRFEKKHKRVALTNLDLVFQNRLTQDRKNTIVFNSFQNILFILIDFIKNQSISKVQLLNKVKFKNEEVVRKALKENKKIIFQTAHYGNWELLGLSIAAKFGPLTAVGRDLDTPMMNNILKNNREQLGMSVISKKGAMRGMVKALNANSSVIVLVDQNTNDNEGIIVNFFDQKVRHTPSLAILARRMNAIIIPTFISTQNTYDTFDISFYEPICTTNTPNKDLDILDSVQSQAKITEQVIKEKPDEWFWFHKRFKYNQEEIYE